MARGTKASQTQHLTVGDVAEAQGPITDSAGAKKGSGLLVGKHRRNRISEVFVDHHVFRVPAGTIASGGLKLRAEILLIAETVFAFPTGRTDPRDAYTRSDGKTPGILAGGIHHTDNLVSRNYRIVRGRCSSFDFIEFGMANAAAQHPYPDLTS